MRHINTIISFLITAFVLFFLVRAINRVRMQAEALEKKETPAPSAPATRECPYCLSVIPAKATKCAHCASEVPPAQRS